MPQTALYTSILFVALLCRGAACQVLITNADAQQWKPAEYSVFGPPFDSVPAFSLSLAKKSLIDLSSLVAPRCTTLDENSILRNAPDSAFRYGTISIDRTERPTGFGTFTYKQGATTVNSFGEVILPGGNKMPFVGMRMKTTFYIESNHMTVILYCFYLITKEYGIVADFTTMSEPDKDLFAAGGSFTKDELFSRIGKEFQVVRVMNQAK
jgi:hypothetical protein